MKILPTRRGKGGEAKERKEKEEEKRGSQALLAYF